jgi:hypothetical protein
MASAAYRERLLRRQQLKAALAGNCAVRRQLNAFECTFYTHRTIAEAIFDVYTIHTAFGVMERS